LEPTRTLPTICGTAGLLLASEALKVLSGQERQALRGEELAYCLLTHKSWRTTLPRKPSCRCPHQQAQLIDVPEGPESLSLEMLVERAGKGGQIRGERPWIAFTLCGGCGKQHEVRRFARLGTEVGQCACGQPVVAGPLGMQSGLSGTALTDCWDQSLAALGVGPGEAISIADDDFETLLFLAGGPCHD
jgi:hypothetical protein